MGRKDNAWIFSQLGEGHNFAALRNTANLCQVGWLVFSLQHLGGRGRHVFEFKASLVCRVNSSQDSQKYKNLRHLKFNMRTRNYYQTFEKRRENLEVSKRRLIRCLESNNKSYDFCFLIRNNWCKKTDIQHRYRKEESHFRQNYVERKNIL